jgi:hypothetical protein
MRLAILHDVARGLVSSKFVSMEAHTEDEFAQKRLQPSGDQPPPEWWWTPLGHLPGDPHTSVSMLNFENMKLTPLKEPIQMVSLEQASPSVQGFAVQLSKSSRVGALEDVVMSAVMDLLRNKATRSRRPPIRQLIPPPPPRQNKALAAFMSQPISTYPADTPPSQPEAPRRADPPAKNVRRKLTRNQKIGAATALATVATAGGLALALRKKQST